MKTSRLSLRGRILNAISVSPKPEWQIAMEVGETAQRVLTELINLEQANLAEQKGKEWKACGVTAPDSPSYVKSVWDLAA